MAWDREPLRHRSMESPGVLFFRVLVMLACLILVPMAAIFGSAFPELVKTILVDRLKEYTGFEIAGVLPQPTVVAAAEPAPAWNGPANTVVPASTQTAAPQVEVASDWEPAPTGSSSPAAPTPAGPPVVQAAPSSPVVDHFTEIQQRLKEYGAAHYALEASGPQGNIYHFRCDMTAPNGVQRFEAADRDALQAMARVLAQVETWRGNLQASSTPADNYRR